MIFWGYAKSFRDRFFIEQLWWLSTQWNTLKGVYLLSKFDVSSLSMTRDFQTGHFADLEQFKFDNNLLTLSKSKLIPLLYFNKIWAGDSYFNEFGQDVEPQKTIQTYVWQKIQEPCMGYGRTHFQWFNQWESRTGSQLISKL